MEKEHRKKAEKEALEQKKHDDELRDVSLCVHACVVCGPIKAP